MVGKFAISQSGHDKGSIYMIVQEDAECVYLADGRLKLVEKPKRKNKKHIQIIKELPNDVVAELNSNNDFQNEMIKRAIKLYRRL